MAFLRFFARHKYLSSKNRSFARLNATAPPRGSKSWSFPVCLIKCNLLLCQIKCNHQAKQRLRLTCQFSPYLICPVNPSSSFADRYMPPTCQWFCENKDAAGSVSNIFTVLTFRYSRLYRDRGSGFAKKLVWFFIHADDRI